MQAEHAFAYRPRPWGATRGTPIVADEVREHATIVLDGATQVARYLDGAGRPVEATGHKHEGTSKTVVKTNPTGGGDGDKPQPPDDPKITTYVPD